MSQCDQIAASVIRPRFSDRDQRLILAAVKTFRDREAVDREIDDLYFRLLRAWDPDAAHHLLGDPLPDLRESHIHSGTDA